MKERNWKTHLNDVVLVNSLNIFKGRLDRHWVNQEVLYNWEFDLTGTGDRSGIKV